jgi:hypothetical protein
LFENFKQQRKYFCKQKKVFPYFFFFLKGKIRFYVMLLGWGYGTEALGLLPSTTKQNKKISIDPKGMRRTGNKESQVAMASAVFLQNKGEPHAVLLGPSVLQVPQKQPPSNLHPTLGFCSFLFLCQDG